MARTSTVTADDEQVDLWSAITVDDREDNLLMFGFLDRRFEEEAARQPGGYERILIHGVGNYASGAQGYTAGSTTLTYEAAVLNAQIVLDVDTHIYHAFELEKETELRIKIPLMEKMVTKSVYAVTLKMDDDAAALIDDGPAGSNSVGQLGVALDEEDVRTAMRHLDNAIAPEDGRTFVMSPYQWSYFLGVERLVNNLYKESIGNLTSKAGTRGFRGVMHGFNWFVTGNVEGADSSGHDNGAFHKEFAAAAVQERMRVAQMYEIDDDADKHALHAVYGLISERGDHLVFMRGL